MFKLCIFQKKTNLVKGYRIIWNKLYVPLGESVLVS
jgi:hypothetical protein